MMHLQHDELLPLLLGRHYLWLYLRPVSYTHLDVYKRQHVIEWVFAKSPGHDANQKDPDWTHVGIGVTDSTVNLIFGGSKM